MINIFLASSPDIPLIQRLAHSIFPNTYQRIISPQQIQYMLDCMYHDDSLKQQIHAGHLFFIINKDEEAVGYFSLQHDHETSSLTKIHKLYVLPGFQNKGIGSMVLDFAQMKAKEMSMKGIMLTVNKNNKAIEFYKNKNFVITREEVTAIGEGYVMDDYIMEWIF